MSKATNVRKKALELVRQQDWQGAIHEYKRLVEMDQSNPNVHNELADIYLKTNAKAEAYDCFIRAIDEYTRVGLYNNAVAVAKKVMRVLPARTEVLAQLGNVRVKQGLTREAESYYVSFLEKVAGSAVDAPAFKKLAREMLEAVPESIPVLHKVSQCLISFQLDEDAGEALLKLHALLEKSGGAEMLADVRQSIERLGLAARIGSSRPASSSDPNRTVVTEDTIWTKTHSAGERIEIESTPHFTPPSEAKGSPPVPDAKSAPHATDAKGNTSHESAPAAPAQPAGPSEKELYLLRLARGVGGDGVKREKKPDKKQAEKDRKKAREVAAAEEETVPAMELDDAPPAAAPAAPPAGEPEIEEPIAAAEEAAAPEEVEAPEDEPVVAAHTAAPPRAQAHARPAPAGKPFAPPSPVSAPARPAAPPAQPPAKKSGDHTQISALIDEDLGGNPGEEDYRSHYDLGMAYMEMDLLAEAIREYQAASKSPQFQVKCLEMIGLCFVRQNQPQLAIRQLTKGLAMIDTDSEESLGMKYNLGLAYEMVGELDKARTQFEDVYVVDVTFRDVAEKVSRLTNKS